MPTRLAGLRGPESADLVANPRRLLVILELHRYLQLLLQALERSDRLLSFEVLPPLEEELEFGALALVILLTVIDEEPADGHDPTIDMVERGIVFSPG